MSDDSKCVICPQANALREEGIAQIAWGLAYRAWARGCQKTAENAPTTRTPLSQKSSTTTVCICKCRGKQVENKLRGVTSKIIARHTMYPQEYCKLLAKITRCRKKKYATGCRRHICENRGRFCSPRLANLAKPQKRHVLETWLRYQNLLPAEIIQRLNKILQSSQEVELEEARCYFKKLDRQKRLRKLHAKERWQRTEIMRLVNRIVEYISLRPKCEQTDLRVLLASCKTVECLEKRGLLKADEKGAKREFTEICHKIMRWVCDMNDIVDAKLDDEHQLQNKTTSISGSSLDITADFLSAIMEEEDENSGEEDEYDQCAAICKRMGIDCHSGCQYQCHEKPDAQKATGNVCGPKNVECVCIDCSAGDSCLDIDNKCTCGVGSPPHLESTCGAQTAIASKEASVECVCAGVCKKEAGTDCSCCYICRNEVGIDCYCGDCSEVGIDCRCAEQSEVGLDCYCGEQSEIGIECHCADQSVGIDCYCGDRREVGCCCGCYATCDVAIDCFCRDLTLACSCRDICRRCVKRIVQKSMRDVSIDCCCNRHKSVKHIGLQCRCSKRKTYQCGVCYCGNPNCHCNCNLAGYGCGTHFVADLAERSKSEYKKCHCKQAQETKSECRKCYCKSRDKSPEATKSDFQKCHGKEPDQTKSEYQTCNCKEPPYVCTCKSCKETTAATSPAKDETIALATTTTVTQHVTTATASAPLQVYVSPTDDIGVISYCGNPNCDCICYLYR